MTEAAGALQPGLRLRGWMRAAALAGGMALAACSTVVPHTRTAAPPPPPPRHERAPTTPVPVPEAERDKVAVLVPLSGANAALGQSIANAANMALLDSNTSAVRLTFYDTGPGAAGAAQRALAEGNGLILGPLLAEDVRIVGPIADAAHVPVISYSNDVDVAGHGVFLMGFTPAQSIDRVVDYAHSRGLTRFAALIPDGLYGRRASNALLQAVKDAGANVVSMQTYDRSPASIAAAVKKLGDPKTYDALLIADSGRIALVAAPLVRKSGSTARLLGTELWNTEPSLAASKLMWGSWFAAVSDTLYRQFAVKYRARYGRSPYRLASLGYDSVLLAVRMAPEWRPGTPFPARRLTDKGGFSGVDGAFRFDSDGIAERRLEVKQIGDGGVSIVSPAAQGFTGE